MATPTVSGFAIFLILDSNFMLPAGMAGNLTAERKTIVAYFFFATAFLTTFFGAAFFTTFLGAAFFTTFLTTFLAAAFLGAAFFTVFAM
jgi:hypothetical protein